MLNFFRGLLASLTETTVVILYVAGLIFLFALNVSFWLLAVILLLYFALGAAVFYLAYLRKKRF